MKLFSTFFALYILCNSLFSQENKTSINDSIISWSKTNKLQWNDYKGTMNPNIFAYAVTSYKIDIIPENVKVDAQDHILNYQDLTVHANFYKNHSWTISADVDLLNHEQLHFDIAEIYARKIRQRFAELKSAKEKRFSTYWDEYNALYKACRVLQKQYDLETNHGAKKAENDAWLEKINALLL